MTDKYGFVYVWFDRKNRRYYIGSHWGTETDGYVCSSRWMKESYKHRPNDFKRRVIDRVDLREDLHPLEQKWLSLIDPALMKPANPEPRYYNLSRSVKDPWYNYPSKLKSVGQKISASKTGKGTPNWVDPKDRGAKISAAKKGKIFSEEHKAALAKAQTRTKQSEETKRKRSEAIKASWANRPPKEIKCCRCDRTTKYTNARHLGKERWAKMDRLAYCPDHYEFRFSLGDRDA